MEANLHALEQSALSLYRAEHLPMIGEWVALPIVRAAGSKRVGDRIYEECPYPAAGRLLECCDAVLRTPGESQGADQDVRKAQQRGLQVFYRLEDVSNAIRK